MRRLLVPPGVCLRVADVAWTAIVVDMIGNAVNIDIGSIIIVVLSHVKSLLASSWLSTCSHHVFLHSTLRSFIKTQQLIQNSSTDIIILQFPEPLFLS